MIACSRVDCENEAGFRPVLLLKPKGDPDFRRAIRAEMGLAVCEAHQDPDPDQLVGGPGFAQIVQGLTAAGMAEPDPDIGIEYQPLARCARRDCGLIATKSLIVSYPGIHDQARLTCCDSHHQQAHAMLLETPIEGREIQVMDLVPEGSIRP